MGNCVTQEMPQPHQRRRVPDSEDEVKTVEETRSVATTPTRDEVHGERPPPNGHPLVDIAEGLPKSAGRPSDCDEEPPLMKHDINEPIKDPEAIAVADSSSASKEEVPKVDVPSGGKSVEASMPEMQKISSEDLTTMDAEQSSDSDSMSSRVSRGMEPGSLSLDKSIKKAPTSDSTSKRSASLFLCLLGLLAGSIVLTQKSSLRDIQSILIRKTDAVMPLSDCKGGACPFLNWVDAHDGLCSLDKDRTVTDVKFTPCPPANSTLPMASAPTCNFAAWVDAQDKIGKCSLDVDKRFDQIWSKYKYGM